jgi:Tfp pilus assembly protein PilO
MPDNQALQVFYGTVPLILIVVAAWLRESMLLKDILARLGRLETELTQFKNEVRQEFSEVNKELGQIKERLVVLETRAGIIYHN